MPADNPRRACEFQLLRYVPDPVRNEFVHIGVVLRTADAPSAQAESEIRFTRGNRDANPDSLG